MADALIINSTPTEVRVALLEHGTPAELYIERRNHRGVVGNIYRGRVVRVLPGMQAAFVDIGLERTAFLYVNDATPQPMSALDEDDLSAQDATVDVVAPADTDLGPGADDLQHLGTPQGRRGFRRVPLANISDLLKCGEEIIVQVQKEPLGTKGARITRQVTVAGRFLVFMPFSEHVGVSHRIEDTAVRDDLRACLAEATVPGCGLIARTAARGIEPEVLRTEARGLAQLWQGIARKAAAGPTPVLLHAELDLVLRATRELYTEAIERVVVDDPGDYERIRHFVGIISPGHEHRVQLHSDPQPIFDQFGIEVELERALERRVWLKSGGYIVMDQAEALTVVDVNSGRYVGKNNLEDTITQINVEAVAEVAHQLRLRNIGGIIIIDFIDMAQTANRDKVLAALAEALHYDKAKTTLVRMSEIGLVEMTRKRVRESIGHMLCEPCSYCAGRSFVKNVTTVVGEIMRAVVRVLTHDKPSAPIILLNVQAEVAQYLWTWEGNEIKRLEKVYHTRIVPVSREGYHREHYEIVYGNQVSLPRRAR